MERNGMMGKTYLSDRQNGRGQECSKSRYNNERSERIDWLLRNFLLFEWSSKKRKIFKKPPKYLQSPKALFFNLVSQVNEIWAIWVCRSCNNSKSEFSLTGMLSVQDTESQNSDEIAFLYKSSIELRMIEVIWVAPQFQVEWCKSHNKVMLHWAWGLIEAQRLFECSFFWEIENPRWRLISKSLIISSESRNPVPFPFFNRYWLIFFFIGSLMVILFSRIPRSIVRDGWLVATCDLIE
jgi:hypothetical protein